MNKLRTLTIGAFAFAVALITIAAIIGLTMEPNHVIIRQATYAQPPEVVWNVISRFDRTPTWRSEIEAVEIESGDPIRFVEMGPRGPLSIEVTEQDPPRSMVLMTSDPELPFSGAWTFELEPVEGGTRLSITEDASIDSPLFRFMAHTFVDPAETITVYLEDLGRQWGQEVTPQPPG